MKPKELYYLMLVIAVCVVVLGAVISWERTPESTGPVMVVIGLIAAWISVGTLASHEDNQ